MTLEEIIKEIVLIIKYRRSFKERGYGWCPNRRYSIARLKRLRLMLNELIKKEEY